MSPEETFRIALGQCAREHGWTIVSGNGDYKTMTLIVKRNILEKSNGH